MRKFWSDALLSAVSTLLALALFVGAYELWKSYEYDNWKSEFEETGDWYGKLTVPSENATMLWEYRSNGEVEKWGSVIRTNRHGFRDREHERDKREGVLRIAFAGDSVTLGIGVDLDRTFVRRVEALGRTRFPTAEIETLGFAVDGYNAIQVMELIGERAMPFSPDIVVYVMCMNDFDLEGDSAGKMKYFRKPDSFFLLRLEKFFQQFSEYHDYHFRKNKALVFERIVEIKNRLAAEGAEFFVALVPVFPEDGFADYPLAHTHEEIDRQLSEKGVAVLNLLESPLAQGAMPRAFAMDVWHLNEEGHGLVAQHLVESLLGRGN
ncbi:MAG: SGNH/GDSL hydrolase family protein [Pseudomonadota bacterium]|nr:SGNH/GDSL hydrolase family protein [Pseudomonadota bacterium]